MKSNVFASCFYRAPVMETRKFYRKSSTQSRLEQRLHRLYALPTDDEDSEADGDADVADSDGRDSLQLMTADKSLQATTNDGTIPADDNTGTGEGDNIELDALTREDEDTADDDDDGSNGDGWGSSIRQFRNIPCFDAEPSVDVELSHLANESAFFTALFDDDIISHIVDETNRYAQQPKLHKNRRSGSAVVGPIKNWRDTNSAEVRAWIGMTILMGIHQMPDVDSYWSSDPALTVSVVANVMPCKRYKKLQETLHLNDNATAAPRQSDQFDKLHKVRPLVDKLNAKIREAYTPSQVMSVDESMIPFKGRSSIKQYMPMKPVKRGYKVWCIADSKTGFILQFEIYTGKATNTDTTAANTTLGERVVLNLTRDICMANSLVAFDNFFTSVNLVNALHAKKIYAVGTVRMNSKGLPQLMKNKDHLERGQFMFNTKGAVAAFKWMDKKPVTVLSSSNSPQEVVTVKRRNKDGTAAEVACPGAIARYNQIMGGVDKFDQLRERYEIGRRSVKWWHRIMYFLIDLAIVNAFVMWKLSKPNAKHDQLTFRLHLARQLIGQHTSRKRKGNVPNFLSQKKHVPDDVRLSGVGSHMPTTGSSYRRCRHCSTKKQEKRTKCLCLACSVPLCLAPCFRQFHSV